MNSRDQNVIDETPEQSSRFKDYGEFSPLEGYYGRAVYRALDHFLSLNVPWKLGLGSYALLLCWVIFR